MSGEVSLSPCTQWVVRHLGLFVIALMILLFALVCSLWRQGDVYEIKELGGATVRLNKHTGEVYILRYAQWRPMPITDEPWMGDSRD